MPAARPMVERFWEKVNKTETCWLWLGATTRNGYGQIFTKKVSGRPYHMLAHRYSYELFKGDIPEGLHIDHLCGVSTCVNPEHLEAVTQAVNNSRQRYPSREQTECWRGHPLIEGHYYQYGKGGRRCKECEKIRRLISLGVLA